MNVFSTRFAAAFCVAFFFVAISYADAQEGPGGLLTDLVPPASLISIQKGTEYPQIHSTNPFFSWTVSGSKVGANQLSYRILVADAAEEIERNKGNIWDSKEVRSSNSVAVPYTGPALQPDKIYYWKVRNVTSVARQGEWSDIVAFKTSSDLKPYAPAWQELEKTLQYPVNLQNNDNTLLADFGRDAFSQLHLKLYSAGDRDTVTVQLGEVLSGKQIHANPGGTIRFQEIRLPLKRGTFNYEVKTRPDQRNTGPSAIKMPAHVGEVFPFRYVSIRDYKGHLQKDDISRQMVHYPFDDKAASFKSSDTLLNAIWELCRYSMKATSFAGIYVDGDRERIPYEADALINQLGHYGTDREFSMARRSLEYLLQYPTWPTEWILQGPIIAWNDYMYTGDNRVLQSNYDLLKNRTLLQLRDTTGLISTTAVAQNENFSKSIHFKGKIRDIVDWPVPETDGFVFCKYNAVVNAYHYQALVLMEKIASALNKAPDRILFSKLSKQLKDTYNRYFLDKDRGIYKDGDTTAHASLHANMFALHFGLAPAEMRNSVADFIVSRGMACSVYGAQFLMDALYDAGRQDAALSLLTARDERSWYNMIRAGSTITLEAWDNKFKPNQDWNHAWGAAPANIIPRRLMGVTPLKPGFQIFSVRPQTGMLKYAESLIPTIRGSIKVRVENGEAYRLILAVPANSSAMVSLPVIDGKNIVRLNGKIVKARKDISDRYAVIAVGPGNHDFTITAAL